jgi:hypothetical protein
VKISFYFDQVQGLRGEFPNSWWKIWNIFCWIRLPPLRRKTLA